MFGELIAAFDAILFATIADGREAADAFSVAKVRRDDLLTLRELIDAGKLNPVIDRTYALAQTAEAVGYAEKQQVRGKVVITVAGV